MYQAAVEAGQEANHPFTPSEELNAVIHEHREGMLQELRLHRRNGSRDPEGIRDQYAADVEDWVGFVESDLGVEEVDAATSSVDQLIEVP